MGLMGNAAMATMVTLPDTSGSITYTANVASQCNIGALPTAVAFTVINHTAETTATAAQTLTINDIVVPSGSGITVSLLPAAATFTLGLGSTGGHQYASSAVSWKTGDTWVGTTGTTGLAGTMSTGETLAYVAVATSTANAPVLSTTGLTFYLALDEAIDRAGAQSLAATWKIDVAAL